MNILTSNQQKFTILLFILTILLNVGITTLLNAKEFTLVWIMVPLFVIPVFIIGWNFGKKENDTLPLAISGFKFHLITYIVTNGIVLVKHLIGLASIYEKIDTVYFTMLFWGLGVILHFFLLKLAKRGTIKGINKSEIFE